MQTTAQTSRAPVRERSLVLSYLGLRKCVGIIGILLPIVLAAGDKLMGGPGVLDSLSAYYYSMTHPIDLRDVWVGSLVALGVFLLSYRFSLLDDLAGNLAGIFAIGVALLPTAPAMATSQQLLVGKLHTVAAAGLLVLMAFFALVLFRKADPHNPPTRRNLQRNRIYLVCGLIILVSGALYALVRFTSVPTSIQALHPVFWLQTLADWAFGVAWLVKGEALLRDKPAR